MKTESFTNNQRRFLERSIIKIKQQSVKYDVTSALIVALKLYIQTLISPNTPENESLVIILLVINLFKYAL